MSNEVTVYGSDEMDMTQYGSFDIDAGTEVTQTRHPSLVIVQSNPELERTFPGEKYNYVLGGSTPRIVTNDNRHVEGYILAVRVMQERRTGPDEPNPEDRNKVLCVGLRDKATQRWSSVNNGGAVAPESYVLSANQSSITLPESFEPVPTSDCHTCAYGGGRCGGDMKARGFFNDKPKLTWRGKPYQLTKEQLSNKGVRLRKPSPTDCSQIIRFFARVGVYEMGENGKKVLVGSELARVTLRSSSYRHGEVMLNSWLGWANRRKQYGSKVPAPQFLLARFGTEVQKGNGYNDYATFKWLDFVTAEKGGPVIADFATRDLLVRDFESIQQDSAWYNLSERDSMTEASQTDDSPF